MSVPDRSNHPGRQATFECEECGNTAPIHEAGVDMVCNDCFDNRYGPEFECTHEKADGSGMCDYVARGKTKAQRRNDLDRHFNEDPEHFGEGADQGTQYLPSFSGNDEQELEDEFQANKDYDREEPKRPYGKSE
jgi:hypothetical protein